MNYFNCLEELLKAVSMPALVLDEDFKVVLINLSETQPNLWEGESPIGKTVFDLFPAEQAKFLHDACLAVTESKQPTTHRITMGECRSAAAGNRKADPHLQPGQI